jgi:predicted O-methyltransferase YrrM
MDIETVRKRTDGIPHMSFAEAQEMTSFILGNDLQRILELGFCHGVSTCYFAAALDKLGGGHITTIDLESARNESPNIELLLNDLNLKKYVTVFYEPTSYVWRLMIMLEKDPLPQFDLCYIDGAHNWFTDGFAFLLVDNLLRPGGWIVFDDLDWTYGTSPSLRNSTLVKNMPHDEKITAQVRKVYELLVKTHPAYDNFLVKNGRAFAHKAVTAERRIPVPMRQEIVYVKEQIGLGAVISKIAHKIL